MCGLAGAISSTLTPAEVDIFQKLMVVSCLRGMKGAGVAMVPRRKGSDIQVVRTKHTGAYLITAKEFYDSLKNEGSKSILIGHTRFPTKGVNEIENVHPFRSGHIIGVHNGTMDTILDEKIPTGKSDSKILFDAIAEHGIKTVIENSTGAYALVWIDKREGTLNFLRNVSRTLYFATPNHGLTQFWASEERFLELVLSREDEKFEPTYLPMDMHYKYHLKPQAGEKIVGHDVTKLEGKKPVITVYQYQGSHGHQHYRGAYGTWEDDVVGPVGNPTSTTYFGKPSIKENEGKIYFLDEKTDLTELSDQINDLFTKGAKGELSNVDEKKKTSTSTNYTGNGTKTDSDTFATENGEYLETFPGYCLTREKVQTLMARGCTACGNPEPFDNYFRKDMVHWIDRNEFACDSCWNNPDMADWLQGQYGARLTRNSLH